MEGGCSAHVNQKNPSRFADFGVETGFSSGLYFQHKEINLK